MPAEIIRDAKVQIASFDFANAARACTINYTVPTQEVTGFGDLSKRFVLDISEWNASIDYTDDFATSSVNSMIWTWITGGVEVAFKARKADSAISPTNPEYQGQVLVLSAQVFAAGVGQVAGGTLNLQGSGTLIRAVA